MNKNLESYIIELESKIRILEPENEALSSKAEENILLNRAFEGINVIEDTDSLLSNILESISVLLNIQFSGIFDFNDNIFKCISSYAIFSNENTLNIDFSIPEINLQEIVRKKTILLQNTNIGFTFKHPNSNFIAHESLIIALKSEVIKNRYFVFINDENGKSIYNRIPLFEKIIEIISAKLERIYYQKELEKLNEQLEQKVELRTKELYNQNNEYQALNEEYKTINEELLNAKEKAEENDKLKTAFLQNMSHEIRTPMNAIIGFSSLLPKNFGDIKKLEDFSKIIEQRCFDLLDIINDILDISKIESGQSTIQLEECNYNELLSELRLFFRDYRNNSKKNQVELILQPPNDESCAIFRTDKLKLKQILINLISNALKFTEIGTIQVACELENNKLKFYVRDTGVGIPKDKFENIFERFSQLNNPSIHNCGGTGLGLAIVKGLVGLLGGKIWLESECNQGTTFFFTIDYIPCEVAQSITNYGVKKEEYSTINKTILIVEDDTYNAMYLNEILKNHITDIYTVNNGVDAIDFVKNNSVDAILMDVRLPDITGYEATKEILKHNPYIKIIAQTAYAAHDERQKAISSGCVDYLSKPTKQEQLLIVLRKYLE